MFPSLRIHLGSRPKTDQVKAEVETIQLPMTRWKAVYRLVRQLGKAQVAGFGLLFLMLALSEVFGVSMMFPIIVYLDGGEAAFKGEGMPNFLSWVLSIGPAIGLPINLGTLFVMAFVPILLRQFLKMAVAAYGAKAEEGTTARLRVEGFSKFIETDLPFYSSHKHGNLVSALVFQARVSGEMAATALTLVGTLLVLVVYLIMLFLISPVMTLVALATAALATAVVTIVIVPKSRKLGVQFSRSQDELTSSITEGLSGVRIVKMLAQEESASNTVTIASNNLRHAGTWTKIYQSGTGAVVEPIFVLGIFGILYVGVEFLGVGLATLGILFLSLLRVMPLALGINQHRQALVSGMASLNNYEKTVSEALDYYKITSGELPFSGFSDRIEFDRVCYSYYTDNWDGWSLRDITLSVPKGRMVALVGRSGAGKSTLVDLIPRLRDPTGGEVRIDGRNIKEFNLFDLRRSIGYVNQDTFLFNETIRNNIAYGMPSATLEQVSEAAVRAYAHDFILATPDGYDTQVGDRGIRLSAGQRQRLGIARVMLQDPDIIILDEPTSALDSESENYIRSGLDALREDKTIIVIAHRLSTIQQADEIIVLDDGQIVERGDHRHLLDKNGDYSRLFELQIHG